MPLQEKQTSKYRVWRNALVLIIGLGSTAFFGVFLFRNTFVAQNVASTQSGSVASDSITPQNTAETVSQGIVLGESDVFLPGALRSENYTLGQVAVGGDVVLMSGDSQESGTLEISGVRGEAFMNKNQKEANVLITWKTTKLATSTVKYGKNGTDASKTVEEDGYGLNHSTILTGLDQASAYVYTIVAKDRTGNEVSTDSYAVYTGTKSTSLFDLISGAVTDTFGWAMKK
jgi:hypothetical protein